MLQSSASLTGLKATFSIGARWPLRDVDCRTFGRSGFHLNKVSLNILHKTEATYTRNVRSAAAATNVPSGFQAIDRNEPAGPLEAGSLYTWVFNDPKYPGNLSFEMLCRWRGTIGAISKAIRWFRKLIRELRVVGVTIWSCLSSQAKCCGALDMYFVVNEQRLMQESQEILQLNSREINAHSRLQRIHHNIKIEDHSWGEFDQGRPRHS